MGILDVSDYEFSKVCKFEISDSKSFIVFEEVDTKSKKINNFIKMIMLYARIT